MSVAAVIGSLGDQNDTRSLSDPQRLHAILLPEVNYPSSFVQYLAFLNGESEGFLVRRADFTKRRTIANSTSRTSTQPLAGYGKMVGTASLGRFQARCKWEMSVQDRVRCSQNGFNRRRTAKCRIQTRKTEVHRRLLAAKRWGNVDRSSDLELGGLGANAAEPRYPGAPPMDRDLAAYLNGPGGKLEYFQDYVGVGSNYRGDKVKPWELSEEKLSAAGLTRETWTLDVISDDGKLLDNPLARAAGNAITYADVLRLAEQRPVRISRPGLPGNGPCVQLRAVGGRGAARCAVAGQAQGGDPPHRLSRSDARRSGQAGMVQQFAAGPSVRGPARHGSGDAGAEIQRPMADASDGRPGASDRARALRLQEHGPVRRIVFTHQPAASDDYIKIGQDVESPTKTIAMVPKVYQKEPLMFGGEVLVGFSGLKTVQYAVIPDDRPLPDTDPYLLSLPWKDGTVLPTPPAFAASIPGGARNVFGLSGDGTPLEWPIPSFLAYWISPPVRNLKPGKYRATPGPSIATAMHSRCRVRLTHPAARAELLHLPAALNGAASNHGPPRDLSHIAPDSDAGRSVTGAECADVDVNDVERSDTGVGLSGGVVRKPVAVGVQRSARTLRGG